MKHFCIQMKRVIFGDLQRFKLEHIQSQLKGKTSNVMLLLNKIK